MNSKELLENLEDNGRDYLLPVRIYKQIKQDLEILELIKKHLYVANGLVEMKITSEEAIDKINKWFWRNFNNE